MEIKAREPGRPVPPHRIVGSTVFFDTPQDALDELLRRLESLRRAGLLFGSLGLRLAASAAVEAKEEASDNPAHSGYAQEIDVFGEIDDEGNGELQISVPEGRETEALAAEIGTQENAQSPLWFPLFRSAERRTKVLGEELAGKVAEAVKNGDPVSEIDLSKMVPLPDLREAEDFPRLKTLMDHNLRRLDEET